MYTDLAIFLAVGGALLWVIRATRRSSRRNTRTDVTPVSEQWLAERRGKQD
jgi:hypothetical protein